MFKEIKYSLMLHILPPAVYLFIRLLRATVRIKHVNLEPVLSRWKAGENFIVCFWHGRLLFMPFAHFHGEGKVLISRHRDGELIARVMRFFGLGAVRGSYRKEGGISSLREILHDLKGGCTVAITPDGPKGPRYIVKSGITQLSRLSGKAIVPVTYGTRKKKLFTPGTVSSSLIPFQRFISCGEIPFMSGRRLMPTH